MQRAYMCRGIRDLKFIMGTGARQQSSVTSEKNPWITKDMERTEIILRAEDLLLWTTDQILSSEQEFRFHPPE
jgi:hypothetical protein